MVAPGPHLRGQEVKRLGGQPACPAHPLECLRSMQFDMSRLAACNFDGVNKGHGFRIPLGVFPDLPVFCQFKPLRRRGKIEGAGRHAAPILSAP